MLETFVKPFIKTVMRGLAFAFAPIISMATAILSFATEKHSENRPAYYRWRMAGSFVSFSFFAVFIGLAIATWVGIATTFSFVGGIPFAFAIACVGSTLLRVFSEEKAEAHYAAHKNMPYIPLAGGLSRGFLGWYSRPRVELQGAVVAHNADSVWWKESFKEAFRLDGSDKSWLFALIRFMAIAGCFIGLHNLGISGTAQIFLALGHMASGGLIAMGAFVLIALSIIEPAYPVSTPKQKGFVAIKKVLALLGLDSDRAPNFERLKGLIAALSSQELELLWHELQTVNSTLVGDINKVQIGLSLDQRADSLAQFIVSACSTTIDNDQREKFPTSVMWGEHDRQKKTYQTLLVISLMLAVTGVFLIFSGVFLELTAGIWFKLFPVFFTALSIHCSAKLAETDSAGPYGYRGALVFTVPATAISFSLAVLMGIALFFPMTQFSIPASPIAFGVTAALFSLSSVSTWWLSKKANAYTDSEDRGKFKNDHPSHSRLKKALNYFAGFLLIGMLALFSACVGVTLNHDLFRFVLRAVNDVLGPVGYEYAFSVSITFVGLVCAAAGTASIYLTQYLFTQSPSKVSDLKTWPWQKLFLTKLPHHEGVQQVADHSDVRYQPLSEDGVGAKEEGLWPGPAALAHNGRVDSQDDKTQIDRQEDEITRLTAALGAATAAEQAAIAQIAQIAEMNAKLMQAAQSVSESVEKAQAEAEKARVETAEAGRARAAAETRVVEAIKAAEQAAIAKTAEMDARLAQVAQSARESVETANENAAKSALEAEKAKAEAEKARAKAAEAKQAKEEAERRAAALEVELNNIKQGQLDLDLDLDLSIIPNELQSVDSDDEDASKVGNDSKEEVDAGGENTSGSARSEQESSQKLNSTLAGIGASQSVLAEVADSLAGVGVSQNMFQRLSDTLDKVGKSIVDSVVVGAISDRSDQLYVASGPNSRLEEPSVDHTNSGSVDDSLDKVGCDQSDDVPQGNKDDDDRVLEDGDYIFNQAEQPNDSFNESALGRSGFGYNPKLFGNSEKTNPLTPDQSKRSRSFSN
jgi:hypothetical protein